MFHKNLLRFTKLLACVMIVSVIILGIALFNIPTSLASELNDDAPFLTPTLAPTETPAPSPTCMNLLDNMTVSHPTVEVGQIFTIDRDVISSVLEVDIISVEQDENALVIEPVDPEQNQYRAVQPGTVTVNTSVLSERLCLGWEWVYGSASVVVTVVESNSSATPAETVMPTLIVAETPTGERTIAPMPTPTVTWTCMNPLDYVTVSHPTLDVGDTFSIDRDIVQGTISDRKVIAIEQDEAQPVVELINSQRNQYRALRTGSVTMTVDLATEESCTASDTGIPSFSWVYGIVEVEVEVIGTDVLSEHRIYLPLIQD